MNENFLMYKLDLEKAEEPEKQVNSRKASTSASLTMLKTLTMWITTNCGKFLKKWDYLTNLPVFWETCVLIKKQQLGPDMEQWNGS